MSTLNLRGRTIHHFAILDELGRGGMAVVYRAHQTDLDRIVALKVLPPELTFDRAYIERFWQEARSAARLEHNHIVPIYEMGVADGFHFIAMKYIEGETLQDVIAREPRMPVARVLELIDPVGRALDYAHRMGVVHRDVKPSNVMITRDGWVYLADFGLARVSGGAGLTQAGMLMGTPNYMSPEQVQGAAAGPPSDLYALASIAYEMIAGALPFTGESAQAILFARATAPPTPPSHHFPSIAPGVEDVLMRALARAPEMRYPSAAALVAALRDAAGLPALSESPYRGTPAPETTRRLPQAAQAAAIHDHARTIAGPATTPLPPIASGGATPLTVAAPVLGHAPAPARHDTTLRIDRRKRSAAVWALLALPVLLAVLAAGGVGVYLAVGGRWAPAVPGVGGDVRADLERGQAAFDRRGGIHEAVAAFEEAARKAPQSFDAHERLALAYLLVGRKEDAERAARAAIAADASKAVAHVWLSQALSDKRQYDEALRAAEDAVRLGPVSSLAFSARATALADLGSNRADAAALSRALADADKAVELSAREPRFNQALARGARGYVKWSTYVHQFTTAAPDETLVADGIDEYNRAIGLQDQLAVFHSNLGYFYVQQGDLESERGSATAGSKYEKASREFETAISLDSRYGYAYSGSGWVAAARKDYAKAVSLFDEALKLDPANTDAYLGRGDTRVKRGLTLSGDKARAEFKAAVADYEAAAARAPHWPMIHTKIGTVYLWQLENPEKAAEAYRAALAKDARFAYGHEGLGWVAFKRGAMQEAIGHFERALAINPSLPYSYVGKALCHARSGDSARARETLKEGMARVPAWRHGPLKETLGNL